MPTNRFQFSDDFVLNNGNVGINTATPQAKLDVVNTIQSDNLKVTGVSSFTSYEGFLNSNQNITETTTISGDKVSGSLSGEIIVGTGVTASVSEEATSSQGSIDSLKVYNTFTVPVGGTADRPSKATPGQLFFNRDFATMEFWDGDRWRQVDNTTQRGRGVFGGGDPSTVSTIDYVNITTTGNALNFGVLTSGRGSTSGCSSNTRGLTGGGYAPAATNIIEYITIASEGNSIDFGDLTVARADLSSCSSSTRGIWGGGYTLSPVATSFNVIDYVQIATIGNALDFGDLTQGRYYIAACSSPIRGLFGGGIPFSSRIDTLTISSTGNAITFGDLTVNRGGIGSLSNVTRGVFAGGTNPSIQKLIDYITISTNGNAINFGDLTSSKSSTSGTSNSTRGIFAGGVQSFPARTNFIDYITIASTGNALDFGDLTNNRSYMAPMSDSHGGLGGF